MAKDKKRSKFRGKISQDVQRQKEAKSSFGYLKLPRGIPVYQPKPGSRSKLDILPYVVSEKAHPDRNDDAGIALVGDEWYKRPFYTHRNIGPENKAVVCLASIGKRCPICDYRANLVKQGAEKEETDAIKRSLRNLYVVVPLDDKDFEEKPHIFDMSQFLFQNLLNDELGEDEQYEVFPDPEEGLTLHIRWDEKSMGKNTFAEASRIDFKERKHTYDEKYLEKVPALDDVLDIMDAKALEKLFLELDDGDVEGGDDEKEDRVSRRREKNDDDESPARSRKRDEEDEQPEEDEPPRRRRARDEEPPARRTRRAEPEPKEEEEEDEPAPRRSRRRDPESEPEDEPEPEPEDEPEPQKSRRTKKAADDENECPSGYEFGVDTDDKKECDDCPLWEKCLDAKEARKGKK